MAFIPKLPFPNVPKLPGVPQLVRSPQFPAAPAPILGAAIALGRLWQSLFSKPQWAIYKQAEATDTAQADLPEGVQQGTTTTGSRTPVIVPDSFLEFGYRNEYSVSDYPVQRGGFLSYDKVANPYETVIRMSKGGSLSERKRFIQSLEDNVGTLALYDILTPEKTYIGVNLIRYEISRRGPKGAFFLGEVDVYFREIREITAQYTNVSTTNPVAITNAQEAEANVVQNIGTVQAQQAGNLTPESLGIQPPEVG